MFAQREIRTNKRRWIGGVTDTLNNITAYQATGKCPVKKTNCLWWPATPNDRMQKLTKETKKDN
jgi:hypothetical protein